MISSSKKLTVLVAVVVVAMFFFAPLASAKPLELSLSLVTPPKHLRNINVINPWVKMIEERTGGKVKITVYYAAALAPPPQTFESTVSGVADISEGLVYATPGRFPLTETVMLPELGLETSLSCSKALWQLYLTVPALQKEWQGVKMLWLHTTPGIKLITRKKPVHSLEDLKGLKIRVAKRSDLHRSPWESATCIWGWKRGSSTGLRCPVKSWSPADWAKLPSTLPISIWATTPFLWS